MGDFLKIIFGLIVLFMPSAIGIYAIVSDFAFYQSNYFVIAAGLILFGQFIWMLVCGLIFGVL